MQKCAALRKVHLKAFHGQGGLCSAGIYQAKHVGQFSPKKYCITHSFVHYRRVTLVEAEVGFTLLISRLTLSHLFSMGHLDSPIPPRMPLDLGRFVSI